MSASQTDTKIEPYVEKSGEEYMNDDQTTHFRTILENWKKGSYGRSGSHSTSYARRCR